MSEQNAFPYTTNLNILFPALSLIDIPGVVSQVEAEWFNQTLCRVNDSVIRLGVMQGEYHWHKHDGIENGKFTGATPGKVLRGPSYRAR